MYCSKCGKELSDQVNFCSGCGTKIKGNSREKLALFEKIDFTKLWGDIKNYFVNFYVDYQSLTFKIAMMLFIAVGIGSPLYTLFISISSIDIWDLFTGATTVFEFLTCAVLFGFFVIPILKLKNKEIIKQSNFLRAFWIVAVVLNIVVFIAGFELYKYVLFSNYASDFVKMLLVISSALLILKNKQKAPIVLIISVLMYAISTTNIGWIKSYIGIYKALDTNLLDIFYLTRFIILAPLLFLLVYILPRKISGWLVYIPSLAVVILKIIRLIESISFESILTFIIDLATVIMFTLFALSCSKKDNCDYMFKNPENKGKDFVKVGIASISSLVVIVVSYLMISAFVCGTQINFGIEKWKTKIVNCELNDDSSWNEMTDDIFKYSCTKFASQFVDDYSFYVTVKENKSSMQKILFCYDAYKNNDINDEVLEEYSYISIDESWESDETLSSYYNKYMQMQPKIDNVDFSATVDVSSKKISVTVYNDNKMPLTACTVKCDFTILFIESGYSSSTEYGRGSKTIVIEDIAGQSKKTKTIAFDPEDYYDSYGSYIMATLFDKSIELVSIE